MNIVFWFCILLLLIGIWFALRPLFVTIGTTFKNEIKEAKESMEDDK